MNLPGLYRSVLLAAGSCALLASCARSLSTGRARQTEEGQCLVLPDSGDPVRSVVNVGVREPFSLDSAPRPRNLDERLVMRQTYQNLVTLDCGGRIRPNLAERWSRDDKGEVWTFQLKPGLQAAFGSTLDAAAVRASWERRRNGGIWPGGRILDVEVTTPRELRVRLATPQRELPAMFADPVLAVTGATLRGRVPEATGPFRPYVDLGPSSGPLLHVWQLAPYDSGTRGPILRIEVTLARVDQRDMLDFPETETLHAADLLATRDPLVLSYARSRSEFTTVSLPWDLTYVLVTPDSTALSRSGRDPVQLQRSLGDVVSADVREAAAPFWWQSDHRCTLPASSNASHSTQVIYPEGDATARELAERIVALGNSPEEGQRNHGSFRTVALRPADLRAALAAGNMAGAVLPLPRLAPVDCNQISGWPAGSGLIPLVDSRAHLVVRRGVPAFTIEADGAIRFLPSPR